MLSDAAGHAIQIGRYVGDPTVLNLTVASASVQLTAYKKYRIWAEDVHQYRNLQAQVRQSQEPLCKLTFCPRCGQLPSGDRRMEEAREIAIGIMGEAERFKMNDLNFLLESYLWEGKHAKRSR